MEGLIRLALLGRDLRHSISPELHGLLFPILAPKYFPEFRHRNLEYLKIECEAECDLALWLKTAESNGFVGANVTIPYKEIAASLVNSFASKADESGSLNTIRIGGDSIVGISTDGAGLLNALRHESSTVILSGDLSEDFSGTDWYVFGSGGAARACLFAMLDRFLPRSITVASRSPSKAEVLGNDLERVFQLERKGIAINVDEFGSFHRRTPGGRTFVLQATPLGQKGFSGEFNVPVEWQEGDVAVDLVFNPVETQFVVNAKNGGAKAIGGLGMLIEQAALAQYFWFTGRSTDQSLLSDEEYLFLRAALTTFLS